MDEDSFSTDLEELKLGMVRLAQNDAETLERVLKELQTRNDSKRKKKPL